MIILKNNKMLKERERERERESFLTQELQLK